MSAEGTGRVSYRTRRGATALAVDYGWDGRVFHAAPTTLEHFLVERYCLYVVRRGRVRRGEIHHPPWDLQSARATIAENTQSPVALPDSPPHLLYSARQDVVVWPLRDA